MEDEITAQATEKCENRKPDIKSEFDKPFNTLELNNSNKYQTELKEQKHNHEVGDFKNTFSVKLIWFGLVIILVITGLSVFLTKECDMLDKTFEFVKTIVTMSLGFILADAKKNK